MATETELKRVLAIARANARTALGKPESQRDSYLAFCHSRWQRYAAGFSRSAEECERFAAAIDRATRDLVTLAETSPDDLWEEHRHVWEDTVEGAMDSVLLHEAYIEPAPATESDPESPVLQTPVGGDDRQPAETAEQLSAEEEDRQVARYGFSGTTPREGLPKAAPSAHARELQLKVREVLRARLMDKSAD